MFQPIFFAVILGFTAAYAYTGDDLPKGPFCGLDNRCCTDRKDDCSHPILGTLCYCDEFCNRSRIHDDCCPDYHTVCLGIVEEPVPLEPFIQRCFFEGADFKRNDTRKENCHVCTCTASGGWSCDSEPCLMDEELVKQVNRRNLGWRAATYSSFWGNSLREGLKYKLGTLALSKETRKQVPVKYDIKNDTFIPASFDARTAWPGWITPIQDQGWCGSDWAVTMAAVLSDRFAVQSNGAEVVQLSAQQLLSCEDPRVQHKQLGCEGGYSDTAWQYISKYGLVDNDCFPYVGKKIQCPVAIQREQTLVASGCRPAPIAKREERYKTSVPSLFATEADIQYDILNSGPMQVIMKVHQDFFHYRDGIYRYSGQGHHKLRGLHSVRVIGWGEDRGEKYWVVANTWGPEWGENGYFRIARGVNEVEIEELGIGVLAAVTEANIVRKN